METIFDKLGGRKMVMSLLVLTVGAAVDLITTRGLSQNLLVLLLAVGGGFTVANVGATIAHGFVVRNQGAQSDLDASDGDSTSRLSMPVVSSEDLQLIKASITALSNRQAATVDAITSTNQSLNQLVTVITQTRK